MKNKKPFADILYFLNLINPFSKFIFINSDILGIKIISYKFDVVGRTLFKTGHYERAVSTWLCNRFKGGGGVFIDVGANLGYYSCLFGKLAGEKGLVLSIEPEPQNLDLLRRNVQNNSVENIVKILPVAVGASEGVLTLNIYKNSNRGRHSFIAQGSGNKIDVPVKTLDSIVSDNIPDDSMIDFMKIDVEGYEPYVIEGAKNILHRVQCLLLEYSPTILEKLNINIYDFTSYLASEFDEVYSIKEDIMKHYDINDLKEEKDTFDLIFTRK
ncbi:MAG: FkbM family methyltransferase [Hoeflea sp.]|nr:FkbM family methyltransferase [Hoeflea sp.]